MIDESFVAAVTEMRRLQRAYYFSKRLDILQQCKAMERHVDKLLDELKNPQLSLFGDQPNGDRPRD